MPAGNTLSHEIAEILRGEILDQRYREGERLPSERAMAARFNASRGAVREAFSQLEQLGIIAVLPGGARVRALSSASVSVLGPLMARGASPDPVLVRQFLQTFGSLGCPECQRSSGLRGCRTDELHQGNGRRFGQGKWRVFCCDSQMAAAFRISRNNC